MCFPVQVVAENWLEIQIDIGYLGAIFHESWSNKYVADVPHYYHKETEVSVPGIDKKYQTYQFVTNWTILKLVET